MEQSNRRTLRRLICLTSLLALAAAPLAAQSGIDLLDPDQVFGRGGSPSAPREAKTAVRVQEIDAPTGVVQATHDLATYYYDDHFRGGAFENLALPFFSGNQSFEQEVAQRFVIDPAADLHSVTVCFERPSTVGIRDLVYRLTFYEDKSGDIGTPRRPSYDVRTTIETAGELLCEALGEPLTGLELRRGPIWAGIAWRAEYKKRLGEDRFTATDPRPTDGNDADTEPDYETYLRKRTRTGSEADWTSWSNARTGTNLKAYGIRMTVDESPHDTTTPDPDPDPDPDPEPPPPDNVPPHGPLTRPPTGEGYTDCVPTVAPLVFDGDNRVSLCYETAAGTLGEAKAGIYKSTKGGLLWFFGSDNPEVLVKVLDGCKENGYRWVFMAAATDVAFNLYVSDGRNRAWSYHNKQGESAVTQTDTMALKCSP